MAGLIQSRSRSLSRAVPRAWTIVGLAGLCWAGLIAMAGAAANLFQFISASF